MFKKIYKNMRFVSLIALIITSVMVFSTTYYIFNAQIEQEIKFQGRVISGYLNEENDNGGIIPDSILKHIKSKSIALISSENEIVYMLDNGKTFNKINDNVSDYTAVKLAFEKGEGETENYTLSFLGKIYTYACKLDNGSVFVISCNTLDFSLLAVEIVVVVVFIGLLIFVFTALISKRLTENIIAPIESISFREIDEQLSPYDELQPFISRIAYQSKEIKRQIDRIKRQKLRLQAISESMNEGLLILDREGNILSLNDSAMSIIGAADREKIKNINIISLVEYASEFAENIKKALNTPKGSFYQTVAGKTYEFYYSSVCDNETVVGVIILIFDMTDKLRNEQIRAEFTANVSHELKTPLTSIHGYAQLIARGMAKDENLTMFAGKIEKESSRLIALVEDIIELSNLDEGKQLTKSEFSVGQMVEEIADSLSIAAQEKNIVFNISGEDFKLCADYIHIHELIYNIVDNAVKYNKERGKVDIRTEPGKVIISDTGIGIPDDCKERIFERFFRVDKSHSKTVKGTGLGLSIVKHIAMNNNIRIDLDTKLGEGTVFTVVFYE